MAHSLAHPDLWTVVVQRPGGAPQVDYRTSDEQLAKLHLRALNQLPQRDLMHVYLLLPGGREGVKRWDVRRMK